jgi:hypothetical protein
LKLPRQLKSSLEEWGRVVPQTMLSSCDGVETKKHQTFCNKPEYKEEKRRTENHNPPIAQGEVTWDNEIERLPSQFAQNNTRDTVYRLTQNKLYTELSLQRLYQAKRPNRHRFSLVYERCLAVQLLWQSFRAISQSLLWDSGIVSQISPQLLPFTSFPIHYSLTIIPFKAGGTR